jgi:Adaptin N terminal region
VYLGIKELSGIAEDVIIVTSSLTKDMTGKEDCYRAAAIRALCTITDPVMLQVKIHDTGIQCCGAGPFLSDSSSGSILSKISAPAPARTILRIY